MVARIRLRLYLAHLNFLFFLFGQNLLFPFSIKISANDMVIFYCAPRSLAVWTQGTFSDDGCFYHLNLNANTNFSHVYFTAIFCRNPLFGSRPVLLRHIRWYKLPVINKCICRNIWCVISGGIGGPCNAHYTAITLTWGLLPVPLSWLSR